MLRGRALLADDDADMRHVIAHALRGLGLEVVEAEDGGRLLVAIGAQYREKVVREEIVLIVTDVRMPVASGLEILEGLRAAHWKQPAILITAHDDESLRASAHRLGATVLAKPIELESFESLVLRLLG